MHTVTKMTLSRANNDNAPRNLIISRTFLCRAFAGGHLAAPVESGGGGAHVAPIESPFHLHPSSNFDLSGRRAIQHMKTASIESPMVAVGDPGETSGAMTPSTLCTPPMNERKSSLPQYVVAAAAAQQASFVKAPHLTGARKPSFMVSTIAWWEPICVSVDHIKYTHL